MAIKTLLVGVKVDTAKHAHNCQANSRHRIEKGDIRLKVKSRNGRSWDHYCSACAATIIARDIATLSVMQRLEPTSEQTGEPVQA